MAPSARTRDALGRTSTVTDTETATLEPALATAGLAGKVSHYFNILNTWKVNCYFNKLNVLFNVSISVDQGFTCVRPLLHVHITLSYQLKIAQQRNLGVYYMYEFLCVNARVSVLHSERFITDNRQFTHRF